MKFALILLAAPAFAWADAAADWAQITGLDAGPEGDLSTRENAQRLILAHVRKQETLLRKFATDYPDDAKVWEARLRLAHTLSLRADLEENPALDAQGEAILSELALAAGDDRQKGAAVAFARLTKLMRRNRDPETPMREKLRTEAQNFAANFPEDGRAASLLTEVSVLYDAQPKQKEQILAQAARLARTDEVRARIADDRKRVALLGKPLELAWKTNGKPQSLAALRGRPVVVTFFGTFSPPSLGALEAVAALQPKYRGKVTFVALSLDAQLQTAQKTLAGFPGEWSLGCDGLGWESPTIRRLGINALPLVWILDREGRLRSLNAAEDPASLLGEVLAEKMGVY